MTIVRETFECFCLTIERDAKRRVVSASAGTMKLSCQPEVPSGELSSDYGSERWADGRLTGTWLDMPYSHECEVDREVAFDAWVRESLTLLRLSVFRCGERGAPPKGESARAVMLYAAKHELLSANLIDPSAEATLKNALRSASKKERAAWRRWFERDGLPRYLEILAAAEGR
jgi:hypothetical protein